MAKNRYDHPKPPLTIVGGQPGKRHQFPGQIKVPVGLEKILFIAAQDAQFRQKLLGDRDGAIAQSGVRLRPSEAGMLNAISNEALVTMIENINPDNPRRRKFMGLVAAATASLAAGTVAAGCPAGSGPETDVDSTMDTDTDTDTDADTDTDIDAGPDAGDTDTIDTDQPTDESWGHTGVVDNDEAET